MRDEIFSLAAGVDLDLDKKITWNEFLRAVAAKRMTEKGRSKQVMDQVRQVTLFYLKVKVFRKKSFTRLIFEKF